MTTVNPLDPDPKATPIENSAAEPLREAAALGNYKAVASYVFAHPDWLNTCNPVNGWTALHWAASRNHPDVVRFLVERGADVALVAKNGKTASDVAKGDCIPIFMREQPEKKVNSTTPEKDNGTKEQFVPSYLKYPDLSKVWSEGDPSMKQMPESWKPKSSSQNRVSDPKTETSLAHSSDSIEQPPSSQSLLKAVPETSLVANQASSKLDIVILQSFKNPRMTRLFDFVTPSRDNQAYTFIPLISLQCHPSQTLNDVLAQYKNESGLATTNSDPFPYHIFKLSALGWVQIHPGQFHVTLQELLVNPCAYISSSQESDGLTFGDPSHPTYPLAFYK